MIKRFLISLIIGLITLLSLIYLQVLLANKFVKQEQKTLVEIDSLLFETRALLSNLDQNIHPLQKQSYVAQANSKLSNYQPPEYGGVIFNPLNLSSVERANQRRLSFQAIENQIPQFIKNSQDILERLESTYNILKNYLEYEATDDLFNRSLEKNEDEFLNRLDGAEKGIQKTLEQADQLKLPEDSKTEIIASIIKTQAILANLIQASEKQNVSESNRLRQEFIDAINNSRIEIDQIIVSSSNRQQLMTDSLLLSQQIQKALLNN